MLLRLRLAWRVLALGRGTSSIAYPPVDYKSAVCFVPSRVFWNESVQEIRCFNDSAFVRWPPHIHLLHPFWQDSGDNLKTAAVKLRKSLETVSPFQIPFQDFRFFHHGNACTVWLEPQAESLMEVHDKLVQAFPECHHLSHDPSRGVEEFTPHLPVGQWPNRKLAEEAITRLSMTFKPAAAPFDNVMILNRRGHQTPFEFRFKVRVGPADDDGIEEINVGYVATTGCSPENCAELPYGIGSYTEGVWNFAYGSNVNQEKLTIGRRLTPLESVPGMLEGYKLAFNHQGGMGNVEPMTPAAFSYFHSRGIHGVHGVLHRLSYTDFARLSNMESGYRPVEVDVSASDGRGLIKAVVFISPKHRNIMSGLAPTERYHSLILEGAKQWNLNADYIRWLESLEPIPSTNRGPLYWSTPEGHRIPNRIFRVGADPPVKRPQSRNKQADNSSDVHSSSAAS